MKEVLRKIGEAYDSICAKEQTASQKVKEVDQKLAGLRDREARVLEIESAQAVLQQATKVRNENAVLLRDIAEARATHENRVREELQKIETEKATLTGLKEERSQLLKDRQTLEADKASYRKQIKDELVKHFQNGGRA